MKKIIWISAGIWFPDSLLWFEENNCSLTLIETPTSYAWRTHYDLFRNVSVNVIQWSDDNSIIYDLLDTDTLVINGGNFLVLQKEVTAEGTEECALGDLDVLYKISKYNHDNRCGAKVLRFFNGDTGFGSLEMVRLFEEKTRYVDTFMFDNDQLMDFVLTNIPSAKEKRLLLGWFETVRKAFVLHNEKRIEKRICSLGRILCSYPERKLQWDQLPIRSFPVKKIGMMEKWVGRRKGYSLAGAKDSMENLCKHRRLFFEHEATCAFGLSHMYDTFSGAVDDYKIHKNFYFSLLGQTMPHNVCSRHEAYYPFCNIANKDICYLMNGIIPLISHAEHNVYKEMIAKKMAVLIKKPEDIKDVLQMPDKEIQEYRDNIYANRDLFTFEHIGEMILQAL